MISSTHPTLPSIFLIVLLTLSTTLASPMLKKRANQQQQIEFPEEEAIRDPEPIISILKTTTPSESPNAATGGSEDFGGRSHTQGGNQGPKIRIKIDLTHADNFVAQNPQHREVYEMSKRLLQQAETYFETFMSPRNPQNLTTGSYNCGPLSFGPYTNEPQDLIIKVHAEHSPNVGFFAAAQICTISGNDSRPTTGVYYLNFGHMNVSELFEYYYFPVFIHELTHIMGFSSGIMRFYRTESGTRRPLDETLKTITLGAEEYKAITLPKVVAHAKEYFDCPTVQGMPLENGGGAGSASSHWEKLYLPNEVMNPSVETPAIVSKFTTLLLEETGWYWMDEGAAQHYDWGKGEGCRHFNEDSCPTGNEYCTAAEEGEFMCTPDYTGIAQCVRSRTFTGQCFYKRASSLGYCSRGKRIAQYNYEDYEVHSRCMMGAPEGRKKQPVCVSMGCTNTQVVFQVDTEEIHRCDRAGQIVKAVDSTGRVVEFECPNRAEFCQEFDTRCPMDCHNNGICMEGNKCFCFNGFSGEDCGTGEGVSKPTDEFVVNFDIRNPDAKDTYELPGEGSEASATESSATESSATESSTTESSASESSATESSSGETKEERKKRRAEERAARKAEREAAKKKRQEERAARKAEREAARKKRQEERAAAKKKRQEERAAAKKKREEERAARKAEREAAKKKRQEERAAAKKKREEERAARKANKQNSSNQGPPKQL